MKKLHFHSVFTGFAGLILAMSVFACTATESNNSEKSEDDEYTVAAYIWPSTHHDARFGDMLWPEGNGEWEVIKKGDPRFDGHYQPKVPLWGYEHDDDPEVMEKWIEAATDHGVNVFIFDWYWFDEGPFLESSLNNGFLKAENRNKMQFYLMWANHDVRRNYWNVHKFRDDTSVMWEGAVDMENFKIIVERVINRYFSQPNYYKIDGRPVYSVFSIYNLVESFGSVEETRAALDYFREETIKAGFPGLHLQLIALGDPGGEIVQQIEALGVNSITKYNWGGPHPEDYIQWGTESKERRKQWDEALSIPYFPNASIGWDDTPRFPEKGKEDVVHYNNSPESFAAFLYKAKEYSDAHPEQPKLITVFSWNEWVEGGYLLPDMKYGFGYLEAVKRVFKEDYNPYSEQ
ncbi:glycosyltransferase WbsX family protein [Rhodohalobacter sulfatireducens]|uniref:Glycoside hydrolase family 99-like domain-containing protein n=1 Tax=Rhodohalobacter sulfatireducens TaxID=2911366 RepID=A0ABS9KIZ1_9BACT|nr:glycoside hydrolase family 99-like domain-containing protein [Rhodohalobacter sulfatireducens]MCG2590767.1 glycoside hydrolase family 99-like domain-containing protein [Rhodohalobacter sulfatireducens]